MKSIYGHNNFLFKCAIPVVLLFFILLSGCTGRITQRDLPNQRILPPGYTLVKPQQINFTDGEISASLYSRNFAQGDAVYAEIIPQNRSEVSSLTVQYNGRQIPVIERVWGYRALFCIPPEMKPGPSTVTIRFDAHGSRNEREMHMNISDGSFKVYHTAMDLGSFSEKNPVITAEKQAFIDRCSRQKNAAFSEMIADQLSSSFAHPRDMHYITSEFYSKRVIEQYVMKGKKRIRQKDIVKTHWGTDFRGAEGTPVLAMAAGRVALSELLYYEGNMIILDHGSGIFTYYMHMSSRAVKTGEYIKAGQRIGSVGSTGTSTGPHLHVSFFLNGYHADPLSLLYLPVKD